MVKRLLLGLLVGALVGAIVAAGLAALGATSFTGPLAYGAAALAGAGTGLVAGKPFWAREARIEAALKAVFGAAIALGLMFVTRKWLGAGIDLTMIHAGKGALGDVPAAALPLVAGVLGAVFGADDTPTGSAAARVRVGGSAGVRVSGSESASEGESVEDQAPPKRAKR